MQNKILLTLLILISNSAFSQTSMFDKGMGTHDNFKTGLLAINLVQQNNLAGLLKLMKPRSKADTAQLANNLRETSKAYPYDSLVLPGAFVDVSDKECYYERNFYTNSQRKSRILLQIHVNMVKIGNEFFVRNIEFRKGKTIVEREAEIKKLDNVSNGPPPPPAVF